MLRSNTVLSFCFFLVCMVSGCGGGTASPGAPTLLARAEGEAAHKQLATLRSVRFRQGPKQAPVVHNSPSDVFMNELTGLLLGSTYSRRRASEAPKLNFPDEIVRVFGQIRREQRWQPTLVALPIFSRCVLPEAESPQIPGTTISRR